MRIDKLNARQDGHVSRKKLRVVAYVRVSAEKDTAIASLENQATTYVEQIKANPEWEFAGIFEDRGISGTKEMRPQFQRMLKDCRDGKIDLILTKSFTRFARNTVVLLETLRELKGLGIEVVFEKDNIRSLNESGELLITLLAAFAQAESQSSSENQKWRIRKSFEEGRLANGGRMLGYRLENDTLTVIPDEAEVVRQIFTDYLSGMGIRAIAKKLNFQRIRTIRQKEWQPCSVRALLGNEKYTGSLLLQKTYTKDYISKKSVKNKGERTQYLVENSHEAIIPKEMFDAVQEEMRRRNDRLGPKHPYPAHKQTLFQGMLVCARCGRHYWRIENYTNRAVWECSTKIGKGKSCCGNQRIAEEALISATIGILGTAELTETVPQVLKEIYVLGDDSLIYVFQDGSQREARLECGRRRNNG